MRASHGLGQSVILSHLHRSLRRLEFLRQAYYPGSTVPQRITHIVRSVGGLTAARPVRVLFPDPTGRAQQLHLYR